MKVIVSVDTEEDDAWDGRFATSGQTVSNIERLHDVQSLCDRFAIKPVYLINNPVVENDSACRWLADQQQRGRCEVGAHVHPWCAPPHQRSCYDPTTSYLSNLTRDEQVQKVAFLTDRIESRLSARPVSFRAGRYGLDAVGAEVLAELGYEVDSSVLPFRKCSDGGPDFSEAPYTSYWPSREELIRPDTAKQTVLEAPVSVGYHAGDFRTTHRRWRNCRLSPWKQLKVPSFLHRTGIARQIKATPEQQTSKELCRLATRYHRTFEGLASSNGVSGQIPCFVILLHSSSLMVGGSPYTRTERDRDRILGRLASLLDFCFNHLGSDASTLGELTLE